jgi:hypothetical protein
MLAASVAKASGVTLSLTTACLLTACGGPPSPSEAAQTVGSWGATAQFVTERWNHSAVSHKFTVVTLARAGSELGALATKVAQLPDTASGRATLVAGLKEIRADIAALDTAAAHDDHATAARIGAQLAIATAQMDTLGDRLQSQQKAESK